MRRTPTIAAAAMLALTSLAAAAEIEIKMLNRESGGGMMVFDPAPTKIEPGDTIKFVATDKGHNAETIKGMLPEGAASFVGKNGEDVTVKFDQGGVHGVKCLPHYGMGMVALIGVCTPANLEQAKAVPQVGKAKQVFATLFETLAMDKTAAQ